MGEFMSWGFVATVVPLLVAVGFGIDRLMLDREKKGLSLLMDRLWRKVEEIADYNPSRTMISGFMRAERRFLGRTGSLRWFATLLALSFILLFLFTSLYWKIINISDSSDDMLNIIYNFSGYIVMYVVLLSNYVFDIFTLIITLFLLKLYLSTDSHFKNLYLLLDLFLTVIVMYLAYISVTCISFSCGLNYSAISIESFRNFLDIIYFAFTEVPNQVQMPIVLIVIMSASVIFPTVIYLIAIMIFYLMQLALKISKFIFHQLLNRANANETTVFFTTATFLSLTLASAKLGIVVVNAVV